ncbi:MAG: N-acetylmuramoyl-L-alanine amidase [bacterium]|nr:N-acetylmuramoyl-L-alanine amidase [bacterium]
MSDLADIKQRVISEAVRENLDVIRGRYRFRRRSKEQRLQIYARIVFLLTLPVAVFFAGYLGSKAAESWVELRSAEFAERVAEDTRVGSDQLFSLPGALGLVGSARDAGDAAGAPAKPTDNLAAATALDRTVFPLGVKKIILDPGHGGENLGTRSPDGLTEKVIALDISERLSLLLEKADFEVALTRTEDTFISLEERAEIANSNNGDLFVSVHLNWIETQQVRGVETYYLGPTDDPFLTELAAAENQHSGYSLADFRRMLDRVFADVRQDESQKLARSVQSSLYNSLRRINPTLQNRGVKKAPFIVLTGTEMPAILAEVSCLSNEREARLLMTPEYRQFIAEALSRGIEGYASELNQTSLRGS